MIDNITAIISQIPDDSTKEAVNLLHQELLLQQKLNAAQEKKLNSRIQGQEWLEVPVVGAIAFFILLAIGLVSVRVGSDGVTFDALTALKTLLEAPAIAAIVTTGFSAIAKKWLSAKNNATDSLAQSGLVQD